jgi:hypothetical protein
MASGLRAASLVRRGRNSLASSRYHSWPRICAPPELLQVALDRVDVALAVLVVEGHDGQLLVALALHGVVEGRRGQVIGVGLEVDDVLVARARDLDGVRVGDLRDAGAGEDVDDGERAARGEVAEVRAHLVLQRVAARDVDGLVRIETRVAIEDLDLAAHDAPPRVELGDRVLRPELRALGDEGDRRGQGCREPELDGALRLHARSQACRRHEHHRHREDHPASPCHDFSLCRRGAPSPGSGARGELSGVSVNCTGSPESGEPACRLAHDRVIRGTRR